jgi:dolichol kinase
MSHAKFVDASLREKSIQMNMVVILILFILFIGKIIPCFTLRFMLTMNSYMEALLEEHKDHPSVNLIYFPNELNRKKTLERGKNGCICA